MWIQKRIREDLDHIHPHCIKKLCCIDSMPHKKAIKIAAYLWEGCFESSNDIWIVSCSGLLYEMPEKWLEKNVQEILETINIDWSDEFEYYNLCAVFRHIPGMMEQILKYAELRIPADNRSELINDVKELIGDKKHYERILKEFESMDKKDFMPAYNLETAHRFLI